MLYGVLNFSTADSTLVDPIVIEAQQAEQAARVAQQAQQAAASQPQPSSGGWPLLLAVAGIGYWYWRKQGKSA